MAATSRKPTTIDEYLATVSGPRRIALDRLRKTIRSIVPKADECISYGVPAFRLGGAVVAGFCARAKGCSYFPFSGSTLRTLARDVGSYDQTRSALHFGPDAPLPAPLVRKLIKARIAEASAPPPRRPGAVPGTGSRTPASAVGGTGRSRKGRSRRS